MAKLSATIILTLFVCVFSKSVINRFHEWIDAFNVQFRDDNHFYDVYRKWSANDRFIETTNYQNLSYVLGHNQFSGMDSIDFSKYLLAFDNLSPDNVPTSTFVHNSDVMTYPTSVDWVQYGAVTPVKDQGQCGSCWSFSSTGALEGAYFIKYGKLGSFSEQQLVDCDNRMNGGSDHGCNGGLMDNAFSWVKKNGGLCTETDYPYVSGTTKTAGTCTKTCKIDTNVNVKSIVDVVPKSDDSMMYAISKQPVAVAIEADQPSFQLYKSGVFTGSCGTNLDHGVLVVGYGTEGSVDYYTVKNSWGKTWGQNGYIKLGRGASYNNGAGQCGVLLEASYPVL